MKVINLTPEEKQRIVNEKIINYGGPSWLLPIDEIKPEYHIPENRKILEYDNKHQILLYP
jgi:hypothetical protein